MNIGQDYFHDPHERVQFQELHALIANLRAIPSLDIQSERQPRPVLRSPEAAPSRVLRTPPRSASSQPVDSVEERATVEDSSMTSPPSPYVPTFTFVASPVSDVPTPVRHHPVDGE